MAFSSTVTRVGSATQFGASINSPRGLTYDTTNSILYFIDLTTLYTLNSTTSVATQVGSSTNFGLSGTVQAAAIAYHNNTLYMIDSWTNRLYTVNTTTGEATSVRSLSSISSSSGLASNGTNLYLVTQGTLYTLAANGAATSVGSIGISNNSGLAWDTTNSVMYMIDRNTNSLYTLNLTNGAATSVGSINYPSGISESRPQGLVWFGDNLYMVGDTTDILYKFDISTVTLAAISNQTADEGRTTPLNVSLSAVDQDSISATSSPLGLSFAVSNPTTATPTLQIGNFPTNISDNIDYEITVTASNNEGGAADQSFTLAYRNIKGPTLASISNPSPISEGTTSINIDLSATGQSDIFATSNSSDISFSYTDQTSATPRLTVNLPPILSDNRTYTVNVEVRDAQYDAITRATASPVRYATQSFTITHNNTNAPSLGTISNISVDEGTTSQRITLSVTGHTNVNTTSTTSGLTFAYSDATTNSLVLTINNIPSVLSDNETYTITVTAIDVQSQTDSETFTITHNNISGPTLAAFSPNTYDVNEGTASLRVPLPPAIGHSSFLPSTSTSGITFETLTLSSTELVVNVPDTISSDQTYTINLEVRDEQYDNSNRAATPLRYATQSFTINHINSPGPIFADINDVDLNEGVTSTTVSLSIRNHVSLSFTQNASNPNTLTLSFTDPTTNTPTLNISGFPAIISDNEVYEISIRAVDAGDGATIRTFNLNYNNTTAPTLATIANPSAINEGTTSININLAATGQSDISATTTNSDVTFSYSNTTSTTPILTVNLPAILSNHQTYTITVTASDEQSQTAQRNFTITHNNTNAPVLTAISNASVNEGNTSTDISLSVIGQTNITAISNPSGLSFNVSNITTTTPTLQISNLSSILSDNQSYSITVTATDAQNQIDTETFTLTHNNINGPTLTPFSPATHTIDEGTNSLNINLPVATGHNYISASSDAVGIIVSSPTLTSTQLIITLPSSISSDQTYTINLEVRDAQYVEATRATASPQRHATQSFTINHRYELRPIFNLQGIAPIARRFTINLSFSASTIALDRSHFDVTAVDNLGVSLSNPTLNSLAVSTDEVYMIRITPPSNNIGTITITLNSSFEADIGTRPLSSNRSFSITFNTRAFNIESTTALPLPLATDTISDTFEITLTFNAPVTNIEVEDFALQIRNNEDSSFQTLVNSNQYLGLVTTNSQIYQLTVTPPVNQIGHLALKLKRSSIRIASNNEEAPTADYIIISTAEARAFDTLPFRVRFVEPLETQIKDDINIISSGLLFPASPMNKQIFIFSDSVSSGLLNYRDKTDTNNKASANKGEIAQYNSEQNRWEEHERTLLDFGFTSLGSINTGRAFSKSPSINDIHIFSEDVRYIYRNVDNFTSSIIDSTIYTIRIYYGTSDTTPTSSTLNTWSTIKESATTHYAAVLLSEGSVFVEAKTPIAISLGEPSAIYAQQAASTPTIPTDDMPVAPWITSSITASGTDSIYYTIQTSLINYFDDTTPTRIIKKDATKGEIAQYNGTRWEEQSDLKILSAFFDIKVLFNRVPVTPVTLDSFTINDGTIINLRDKNNNLSTNMNFINNDLEYTITIRPPNKIRGEIILTYGSSS